MKIHWLNEKTGGVPFIYGMKGLACVGVMVGHVLSYLNMLYEEQIAIQADRMFDYLYVFGNNVAMFALISGFLMAESGKKKARTFMGVSTALLKRYFRFSLPILVTVLFNGAVGYTIGFEMRYANNIGFVDALYYSFIEVFIGSGRLNGPFWMMGDIFWGSIAVIILNGCINAVKIRKPHHKYIGLLTLVFALIIVFLGSFRYKTYLINFLINRWVFIDVVIGFLLYVIIDGKIEWKSETIEKCRIIWIAFLGVTHLTGLVLRNNYQAFFQKRIFTQEYWLQLSIAFCIAIFFCVISSGVLKRFFSNSLLVWLGKRSFWIFGLHSAVIYAITYKYVHVMSNRQSQYITIVISIIVTTIITAVIADLFYRIESVILRNIHKIGFKATED